MVRVAGLMGQIAAGVSGLSVDGLSPQQQLARIHTHSTGLEQDMQARWHSLRDALADNGVFLPGYSDLSRADRAFLHKKFAADILPILTPIAMDPAHPFPFIPNRGLAIALQMHDHDSGQDIDMLIPIPAVLERFVTLPEMRPEGPARYMMIEKVIMRSLGQIFPEHMEVLNYAVFRIIRDSEMEIEEEAEDLVRTFETALKRRRRGQVVTLSVYHTIAPEMKAYLKKQLDLADSQIITVDGLVGLCDAAQLIDGQRRELVFPPFDARFPERIREHGGDCFAAIAAKDIIVHHPYESFDVVVRFIEQAARDPDVISIKQTLYRTSADSPMVAALIEAAESGKSVTALVELKARFDEEANIRWARDMERAGVQVVYGFMDLKTHAKVSLVVRRESGRLRSYAHFGTGNYHPQTAKIYTDLSFFTCDEALCRDAGRLFNYMTGYAAPQGLEKLAIAPFNLRETLAECIDNETRNARAGKPAGIWLKCNAVLDSAMIDKLYEAAQAGVPVEIISRGICTLRPGLEGFSETIRVKSIVGRFLEHARIYCFANGHALPSRQAKVFISSADLMKRNLSRRIEALVPIENPTVHRQVLDQIMAANLKDSAQSWLMDSDGSYERCPNDQGAFSAHGYFMTNPSLSGRGRALDAAPAPPRLKLTTSEGK